MNEEEKRFNLALKFVPGIGNVLARNLVAYCGSAEAVFREKPSKLEKIPGIGRFIAGNFSNFDFTPVDAEMEYIIEKGIKIFLFWEKAYPDRLRKLKDAPFILFGKGNLNLNPPKVLGIVGTRRATPYGKDLCRDICERLTGTDILIVSGLAYGIDKAAHAGALKNGLPTVAAVAHGLRTIYPASHSSLAKAMEGKGGLVTEYTSLVFPDKENFPSRNRIIAGMVDALIVVETSEKGGGMITARIANSLNREVMTFPGRVGDVYSKGCNSLIKNQQAQMIESAGDILEFMGWEQGREIPDPPELDEEEKILLNYIRENKGIHIDTIGCFFPGNPAILNMKLLNLEIKRLIRVLPGKYYISC